MISLEIVAVTLHYELVVKALIMLSLGSPILTRFKQLSLYLVFCSGMTIMVDWALKTSFLPCIVCNQHSLVFSFSFSATLCVSGSWMHTTGRSDLQMSNLEVD